MTFRENLFYSIIFFLFFGNFLYSEKVKDYYVLGKVIAIREPELYTMEADLSIFNLLGGIYVFDKIPYYIINHSNEILFCFKPLSFYQQKEQYYIHLIKIQCNFITIQQRDIIFGDKVITLKINHQNQQISKEAIKIKKTESIIHPVDKKEMIYVPADYFIYGQGKTPSDSSFNPNYYQFSKMNLPYIQDFYIDKYEITNQEFLNFCKQTKYKCPEFLYHLKPDEKDIAYINASYEDVINYAKWTKKEIPTEWEWELAAKGGLKELESSLWESPLFPDFAVPEENCNTKEKWMGNPQPLNIYKLKDINFRGLVGMCGNAPEWTSSYFFPYPSHKFTSSFYKNLSGNFFRVLKGGAYFLPKKYAKVYKRIPAGFPEFNKDGIGGFRLVIHTD